MKVAHRNDRAQIKRLLAGSGQALLPMPELLEGTQASIDELMHETAVALVGWEQLLVLSVQELAGAKQRGRDGGPVLWHGAQRGVVALAERQLRVQRPRLRDKNGREVAVPAFDRLRDDANMGARVRDILVAGVSTRRYAAGLPEAAGLLGVSKSTVSRRFIEASAFGQRAHVQRCRTHPLRNVLERRPKTEAAQTKAVMMAAYKLAPKDGMAKMKQQAQWLEREHPDVAASLLEGLHENFTVNALGLPPTLMRCLCTTKLIENPNGIVRRTSRRVTRFSRRQHGAALVGSRFPRSREIVQRNPGHQGPLDPQG